MANQLPPRESNRYPGGGGSGRAPIPGEGGRLVGVLNDVANHLYAAGLDLHVALQHSDRDTEPAKRMRSVVARLDRAITTILRDGLARTPNAPSPERMVLDAVDVLAAGLDGRFDLAGYLQMLAAWCVDLPGIEAASVLLTDRHAALVEAVVRPDRPPLRALCTMGPSPSRETAETGDPQSVDLTAGLRLPAFAAQALAMGFRAVHTAPVRLPRGVHGVATVYTATSDGRSGGLSTAHRLAELTALGLILGDTALSDLPPGLTDRPRIAQAEGILAERHQIPIAAAATALVTYARRHGRRLADAAGDVIDGDGDGDIDGDIDGEEVVARGHQTNDR